MPASYPNSAKTFTTKSDGPGNTILAAHINDLQLEVTAIETDLIAGIPVARGGTGATSLSANRVPYTNGAGSALTSAAGFTFDGTTLTAPATTITQPLTISGASAGQIVFPASQNASSNDNTLDDYEEGTYTPTWTSGTSGGAAPTIGNGTITGRYVKVGRQVTVSVHLTMGGTSTFGNATDAWTISLPFTADGSVPWLGAAAAVDAGVGTFTGHAVLSAGGTTVSFHTTSDAVAVGNLWTIGTPMTWVSTDQLRFTLSYMASA